MVPSCNWCNVQQIWGSTLCSALVRRHFRSSCCFHTVCLCAVRRLLCKQHAVNHTLCSVTQRHCSGSALTCQSSTTPTAGPSQPGPGPKPSHASLVPLMADRSWKREKLLITKYRIYSTTSVKYWGTWTWTPNITIHHAFSLFHIDKCLAYYRL